MISLILVYVPEMSPINAAIVMIVFLVTISAFSKPLVVFQKTHVCINAGNASPSAERQRAPNKLINNSKLGIATASKTKNSQN